MELVGNSWQKCDLHLHTMVSRCYKNKKDTYEDWIQAVKEKGLKCVAVTDHNDYRSIDELMKLGKENDIVVFPGVEVTCDSSKIHILVIFDTDCTSNKVRDFLIRLDIDSDKIGTLEAMTDFSVMDVCKLAKKKGAMVIAAHIDEFSSISSMSNTSLKEILNSTYLDGVQVSNKKVWEQFEEDKNEEKLKEIICEKYQMNVSMDEIQRWYRCYSLAKKSDVPMVSFSDNPASDHDAKHGLWGIARQFTWLKMGDHPTLESIRQALIASDERVILSDDIEGNPNTTPDLWIQSVAIKNTKLNTRGVIKTKFHPQMNCVIGPRGSGKSSLLRILVGSLVSSNQLSLDALYEDQRDFYKAFNEKQQLGIFQQDSIIEIEIVRNSRLYKVVLSDFLNKKKTVLYEFDEINSCWNKKEGVDYLQFFPIEGYTQKQVFAISRRMDAFKELVDKDVPNFMALCMIRDEAYKRLLTLMKQKRDTEKKLAYIPSLLSRIEDIDSQIELYKDSPIFPIIEEKLKLEQEKRGLNQYLEQYDIFCSYLEKAMDSLYPVDMDKDLTDLLDESHAEFSNQFFSVLKSIESILELKSSAKSVVEQSNWKKRYDENNKAIKAINISKDSPDYKKLRQLLLSQKEKKENLTQLYALQENLPIIEKDIQYYKEEYMKAMKNIHDARQNFVNSIISDKDDIRIEYNFHKDMNSFKSTMTKWIQKDMEAINDDLEYLHSYLDDMDSFRNILETLRRNENVQGISNYFRKIIASLDVDAFDCMITFIPDDEMNVSYRPEGAKLFYPIQKASVGQKTTAILTYILSSGSEPLLLDQPEDDLDNRLVYHFIVKRLKKAKQSRQIIIATHNANIPVNAQTDYMISMSSNNTAIKVKCAGSLDNEKIREEILDVLEGGQEAFKMRAKKYHLKIVE